MEELVEFVEEGEQSWGHSHGPQEICRFGEVMAVVIQYQPEFNNRLTLEEHCVQADGYELHPGYVKFMRSGKPRLLFSTELIRDIRFSRMDVSAEPGEAAEDAAVDNA